MANITGEELSSMSLAEIQELVQHMKTPTKKQKEIAWKKMDTGIYDSDGELIGDMCREEDGYME